MGETTKIVSIQGNFYQYIIHERIYLMHNSKKVNGLVQIKIYTIIYFLKVNNISI